MFFLYCLRDDDDDDDVFFLVFTILTSPHFPHTKYVRVVFFFKVNPIPSFWLPTADQTKDSPGTLDATSATAAAAAPAHGGNTDAEHGVDAPKASASGEHASNGVSNALSLAQGKAEEAGATGGAGEGGAEAVGGFLAGPLSPAQLAPLSVTMEDFMAAVKKVRLDELYMSTSTTVVVLAFFARSSVAFWWQCGVLTAERRFGSSAAF